MAQAQLGDVPLSQVDNKTVKGLVTKLAEAKLAPKTIVDIVAVAKMVVASARDDNGKRLYPREWNHEFIDLPVVKSKDQDTPTVEAGEVPTFSLRPVVGTGCFTPCLPERAFASVKPWQFG